MPHPPAHDLTARMFRALYAEYDLLTLGALHIVTQKGSPLFIGDSLGQIARRISEPGHPGPSASGTAPEPG